MDQLLARIRDRKGGIRSILTDRKIYEIPDMINAAIPYSPEDSLEEGEWFYLPEFSKRSYCPEFVTSAINNTAYALIDDSELDMLAYICCIQDEDLFCFQNVTKRQLLKRRVIVFGSPIKYSDGTREISINQIPDAIYRKNDDRLFFRKLSAITACTVVCIVVYCK